MQLNNIDGYIKEVIGINRTLADDSPMTNTWYEWYKGFVKKFHRYQVYNDGQYLDMEKLSLGMAKKVCEDWADLLINKETDIIIDDKEKLDKILKRERFWTKANQGVEKSYALGNGAFVVRLKDAAIDDKGIVYKANSTQLKIDFINATKIRPITYADGDIIECAFVNEGTNQATLSIHLLENGQYVITELTLRKQSNGYQLENKAVIYTGSDVKWFAWLKPNKVNNLDINSPLGVSIFNDAVDNLKIIDNIFDGFNNEYQLGKKRVMVASDAVKIDISEGEPRKVFDLNDVLYYQIPTGNDGKPIIQDISSELRTQAYIDGLNNQLSIFGSKCGLGESFYKFDAISSRPVQTATASKLQAQNLYRSIEKMEVVVEQCLVDLTQAIIYVNNAWTNEEKISESDINIKFDDAISTDKESERERDTNAVKDGLMSKKEFVMKWYLMNESEAVKYLQENLLLLNDYLIPLQSGAMSPEEFVNRVYGYNENSDEYTRAVIWATEQVGASQEMPDNMIDVGA